MLIRLGGQDLAIVGRARVYICGITPYDATHVGHAATFVWSDVAVRFLRLVGHEVQVTRNITDVDDSLLTRARETGTPWRTLATRQTYQFEDDMARLGVSTPTFEPQAHNYVGEVIELTQGLLDLGHAYERGGTVYARHPGVAEQAGLSEAEALALASERGEDPTDAGKDHPLDTPLWRRVTSDDEGPGWDSPWGPGRPGWHVECSAMALTTLGPGLDLHCGGADLAFPHHAFEAAHAEAVTGVTPFARSWIRAGAVHYQGQKMAKSIGNLVMVRDLLADHTAAALRLPGVRPPVVGRLDLRCRRPGRGRGSGGGPAHRGHRRPRWRRGADPGGGGPRRRPRRAHRAGGGRGRGRRRGRGRGHRAGPAPVRTNQSHQHAAQPLIGARPAATGRQDLVRNLSDC
jgi:cysteinyl-tRNA synthetase